MPDKNFKSYEEELFRKFSGVSLLPDVPLDWDDTMKAYKCVQCIFEWFYVTGGKEDVLDASRETSDCAFRDFHAYPHGQYVCTVKGGSHRNHFLRWLLHGHGAVVDFEFGNWSTYNFERSEDNLLEDISAEDGKPITFCYRWGCRPTFINTKTKHLWWRSIGLTVYWHFKYVKHVILKRPDDMGHPEQTQK